MTSSYNIGLSDYLTLVFDDIKLEAWIVAPLRKRVMPGLSPEDIEDWLEKKGVIYGIKDAALAELAAKLNESTQAIPKTSVAQGKPAIRGADGYVEFYFNTSLQAGKVEQDGHVNFHERGLINNTHVGLELLRIIPAQLGQNGIDVLEHEVIGLDGEEAKVPIAGEGVDVREDGEAFFAAVEGNAQLINNTITVTRSLTIDSDIDFNIGNIDFVGDLKVNGKVLSGFELNIRGNLCVDGSIERNSLVSVGGDLEVKDCIRCGQDKPHVICQGNLTTPKIENSFIKCKGDVIVEKSIVGSKIRSKGQLIASKAELRGSDIEAVGGLEVGTVGTKGGVNNILTAGLTLEDSHKLKVAQEKIIELKKVVKTIKQAFSKRYLDFINNPEALQNAAESEVAEYNAAKQVLEDRLAAIEARIKDCDNIINTLGIEVEEKTGTIISVARLIHPTCTINIRWDEWVVRKMTKAVIFFDDIKNSRIGSKSYRENALEESKNSQNKESAPASLDIINDLSKQVDERRIGAQSLAIKLTDLANVHEQNISTALNLGLSAVKQKRYQNNDIFVSLCHLLCLTAKAREKKVERETLLTKAVTMLKDVLNQDAFNPRAMSVMGMVYELMGQHPQAVKQHKRAVELAGKVLNGGVVNEIRARYALALAGLAQDLKKNGKAEADSFVKQARDELRTTLDKGVKGLLEEECEKVLGHLR